MTEEVDDIYTEGALFHVDHQPMVCQSLAE